MIINSPHSPYIFQSEFINLRWYGFLIAVAILISYLLIIKQIKKEKIDEGKFDTMFIATLLFGIIGARLAFILQNTSYYFAHPLEMLFFFDGGLSIHGAIILGGLAMFASCRKLKINFLTLANIVAPFLLLSGAIGRWGNYFNQEIVGKPSSSFFKMFIDTTHRPINFDQFQYFHPVFLYESILLFCSFIVFFALQKRLKNFALVYTLVAYSLIRIIVEFWRIDYKPFFLGLDLAQLTSFAIIVFVLALLAPSIKLNALRTKISTENSVRSTD